MSLAICNSLFMFAAHTKCISIQYFKITELPYVNINILLSFYVKEHKIVWLITF